MPFEFDIYHVTAVISTQTYSSKSSNSQSKVIVIIIELDQRATPVMHSAESSNSPKI